MDEGRFHDLKQLHAVLNNPHESELHKRQARRAISKIQKVARDPQIRSARERLIRAQRAGDHDAVEKIGESVIDVQRRKYGFV